MNEEKRFVVKKDAKSDVITYMEYEKLKGFNVKPKDSLNFEDMINVNEMIIINPTLIEKLIDKKCKRTLEKILTIMTIIDDDSDDDTPFDLVLDELERFKSLVRGKYKEYMKQEKYKLVMKKIEIIEKELNLRKSIRVQEILEEESRRSKPKR